MAAKYKKRNPEEIKKEVKELSESALEAIKNYSRSPEDMKELLDFMSKFPERSFRNQLLIEQQFPGAVACLGQAAMKKQGVYIKKGEIGNRIFVHKTVKGFIDKERGFVRFYDATREDKNKIINKQIDIIEKPYFTLESVFDVSQTQMQPEDYPKVFPGRVFDFKLDDQGKKELQVGIDAVANDLGIDITLPNQSILIHNEIGRAKGVYVRQVGQEMDEIVLNERNTETEHLATSIHELAHAQMHKYSRGEFAISLSEKEQHHDTAIKEFQAEMTSYIVSKHFGLDTFEKAIPYISSWTKNGQVLDDESIKNRGNILNDVSRVANEFIRTMSTEINSHRLRIERTSDIQKTEQVNMVKTKDVTEFVGTLWIDKKDGKVLDDDNGRSLTLKDASFTEDQEADVVLLKGKVYGKDVVTKLPSNEFALGTQFTFPEQVISEGEKRKSQLAHEAQNRQMDRV